MGFCRCISVGVSIAHPLSYKGQFSFDFVLFGSQLDKCFLLENQFTDQGLSLMIQLQHSLLVGMQFAVNVLLHVEYPVHFPPEEFILALEFAGLHLERVDCLCQLDGFLALVEHRTTINQYTPRSNDSLLEEMLKVRVLHSDAMQLELEGGAIEVFVETELREAGVVCC